jgi:amino acid adenylation domain-containing protein
MEPEATLLHETFEAQAARTPDALAVASQGVWLTYRELEQRANQLARHLRTLGVGPEVRVGVCLDRSADLVVGLLAVLKAGGAYVPLDPEYPEQRLAFILEDSAASLVLTQERWLGVLPKITEIAGRRVLVLDRDEVPASPCRPLERWCSAGSLAYLIYTSGSTGRPKAVAIVHRSVVSLLRWTRETFTAAELAGVLASTSICFDLSVFEIFAPLSLGGTVILAGNALELPYLPADPPVTLINTVPSAMAELARSRRVPASVKVANLAGEALPRTLVDEVYRTTSIQRVLNLYGPSEDTTYSTVGFIAREGDQPPPIGRPITGTSVHLLAADGSPAAAGEEGEVFLGGEGLARGYFGRPDLTAARFVPDSFGSEPGRRLYRTGDLARPLPDGQLHYLGRVDQQVKIRGFRIELGEVENALARHPAVREAAVTAHGEVAEGKFLVAYLAGEEPLPKIGELRSFLAESLPSYMIPSQLVAVDALPRTLNGKIDRQALAAPGTPSTARPSSAFGPFTPVAETLARIWADVLHREEVGPEDDFFHLGGHSLLGARVLARVRETFGLDLPLQALFRASTVTALAGVIASGLSDGGAVPPPPVHRAPRREPFPLSFSQERFWVLDGLQPGGAVYNVPLAVRLEGSLDAAVLEAALGESLRRHEALRTRFIEIDGTLVQEVVPGAGLGLARIDLAALPAADREKELTRLVRAATAGPFDLSQAPLMRAWLVRLGPADHALLLTFCHAVFDGWSQGVLNRELSALYAAGRKGRPSPLPEPPVQYGDYAVWQRSWLTAEVRERLLDGWRRELAGVPTELELPTDRPRVPFQACRGAVERSPLPAGLAVALSVLARDAGATRYMVLLAGFQALVGRLTGAVDFLIGAPSANRPRPELEGVVGLLLETLALRGRLGGDPPFRELLARVRETALWAYAHQDLPFEQLVAGLGVKRSPGHSPLIQVIFSLQAAPEDGLELPGLGLRLLDPQTATSRLDLSLVVEEETGGALRAALEYDTDLFEPVTARRFLGRFLALLAEAASDPARRLSEIPVLSPAERHQLVVEWNDTDPEVLSGPGLLQRLEEWARRQPAALAVAQGDRRVTYSVLAARAGRLARRLRRLGVGPESRVAVCLPRSIEAVVAFLGIWKAGGAYVPLDPALPPARLNFMLDDAGAPVLVAQGAPADALVRPGLQIVDPGAGEEEPSGAEAPVPPGALAYVIYTSGSTGRPKGVEVGHRSLLNLVEWHLATYRLTAGDHASLLAGVGFDASVWEIWPALAAGASLHLPAEESLTEPAALRDWMVEQEITVSFLPTPLAELMLALAWPQSAALRAMLTGGDALHRRPPAALPFTLINHYGPTEATVVTTAGMVVADGAGLPPIGRPIHGLRVQVLDAGLRLVPAGVPGELAIGGVGLARGYLGAPAETAARYVPDPFSGSPGARLYRTGDLVRLRSDGEIEFLGRIDRQVKVRGFRMELGEIEAALAGHPAVRQAAVVVTVDPGGRRLVAFCSPRDPGEPPPEAEVRDFLRRSLPEHMVPAVLVTLPELPLSSSGKVDRQALAGMVPAESGAAPAEALRTPTEERIARIWCEVLSLDRVSPRDDFFRLGGHSLLVGRVIARLRAAFGVELPVQTLFRTPTLEGVAAAMDEVLRGAGRLARPKMQGASLPVLEPAAGDGTRANVDWQEGGLPGLVAGVLAEVLGLPSVEPDDDFFELGGHSLLGARALARIRELSGADLRLRDLFQAPTAAGLAARVAAAVREGRTAAQGVRRVSGGGLLSASYIQESLWFIYLLDPVSPVYNIPLGWRLSGPLDATALEKALAAVVGRHEVLRATFVEVEGQPFLEVASPAPVPLPRTDLSSLPVAVRAKELARRVRAEAALPFDLGRGPLLRARLAILAPDEHALALTLHHSVFDGSSQRILTRDLAAFYEAAISGLEPRLPDLPVQYSDFAAWQRNRLQGAELESLLSWWRRELAGVPTILELPADRPRPPVQTFRGAWEWLAIPAGLAGRITALGRREGATTFMTLLAAFQVLLHRFAGQDDLLVGSPVANRPHPELEDLIGYFVETLLLRGRFAGAETFPQRLARVRETVLGAFSHQDLPFGQLAADLQMERDPSRNPLFQVMFALDQDAEPLALQGIDGQPLAIEGPTAKFDLSLGAQENSGALRLSLEYNLDLFDRATARRLLEGFAGLLAVLAAEPDQRLDAIPLVSSAELRELVAGAERSVSLSALPLAPLRLHDLFTAQAARTPERVALLTPAGERLTYAELDLRSDRLARFLVRRGVGPEVPVAVCLERSPELVIAMLGILKAGGVYLPLDPAYPADRLAFMLANSGAVVALTRRHPAGELPAGPWEAVAVDDPEGPLAALAAVDDGGLALADMAGVADVALPESLAYLIYTSGSTGQPKGVGVSHAAAAEHIDVAAQLFGLGEGDRMLWFASPSFDISMEEVLAPLARGAAIVLREADLWSSAEFLDQAAELGLTVVDLPTAYWHQWAADCEWARPPAALALRRVVLGGEAMSGEAARRWRRSPLAGIPLLNAYGPTEGVVTSTAFEVDAAAAAGGTVPIGRALGGRATWVLDRCGHPAPAGVAGELCLGGPLLARGYLGRPELTAERFVPDPFAVSPGARLYRTGDRARRRPDSVLEFLGRVDRQLKVRGFRVEPGEIESALARHPGVRETVVDARPDLGGDLRLVAWIVPAGPAASAAIAADLGVFLRGALPDHMVPVFVAVEELPLTPNGKVNLRALPDPEFRGGDSGAMVPPRTPVEERLAGLWRELLGRPQVSVEESFFVLGGHSLLATRLLSRVRDAFGIEIPVRALFSAPTIAGLASLVEIAAAPLAGAGTAGASGEGVRGLPPIAPAPRDGLLPLSFPQQRMWFVERLAPDGSTYNIPLQLRLRGRLQTAALAAAWSEVVRRHEVLRTRFVERDGQPWQEVLPPGLVSLPEVDLRGLPAARRERELARLGREDAGRPFDLSARPVRQALIRLADREHALFLTLHHIAFDAWSEDVLYRELSVLYAAALTGQPAELPELRIQYGDFAAWQRAWPEGVLADQLAYWAGRLAGLATLEIPTDRPRPPLQTFRGGTVPLFLPPAAGAALRALAERTGVTLFMLLLAGWQTLLHRISGQTDVAVGSPAANRSRLEIEGLIGFFINMLAYRTDFAADPSFAELLGRVRQGALEAYDHADVPFERLVDELRLERDLSRQPLVQVMFALQDAGVDALRLPEVIAEPLHLAGAVAKFDLTLFLSDAGEAGFDGWIEYSSDLFDRSTVLRLAAQLGTLLESAAARPGALVSQLDLLTPPERHQVLREWNDTGVPFPETVLIHQLFEAQVDRAPGALAAVWRGETITYAGLEARANRLAHLLRRRGMERGAPVAVWLERSLDMLVAVLGILKAGGYYVPLDPAWPAERVEGILANCQAPAVLTRSAHLAPVLEMQWRLPALTDVICLDAVSARPDPEPLDVESVRAVFDLVAERAVDRASAGGFVSSFTGEPFAELEVDEYRDRVLALALPWLGAGKRVLEIGCGSGLLLWEIAPRVERCVGLDPSALTQERNRARAAELGAGNVELPIGFAHEIVGWPGGTFDLVILASTVQFFPGPLYLEQIVAEALRLLAPGGTLLIADVPDARRQEELRRTVEERRSHGGLPPRQDPHKLLSLDEDLFRDLAASLPGAGEVAVLHRDHGFDNELGFRYDVLLTRAAIAATGDRPRRKRLWTSWHLEGYAADRLPAVASPEDLAYVIHTSGSTGQPKGIAVQHRPVANLFAWLNAAFGIGPDDRVLFVTSLCFDLSVYDVFGLLAAGGCVHVAAEEDLRDAERLVRLLLEEPVTLWDSAPAALVRLAPLFPLAPVTNGRLRRVMLSGDWIPVTLPDRVRAVFPHAEVTSLGGATEATVWSNWYPVGEVDPAWPSIPYGRPIGNARYHVLDAVLQPCPIGVPGNLYIGGDVLCVGYAHQPEVTGAAFRPDPFSRRPGARIYHTGDRARWFADGNLEFLGRVDQQVKIRGFRIELGEIEVALARHPEIREAVVLAREDVPGDKRLVAYVVPATAGGPAPAAGELRELLRRSLPDYMIPAAFVGLDHLPVTANGKLDRRALPAPRWDHAEAADDDLPLTATEEALAGLWRDVLSVERVGRHDDFFDLGGHSLLATQLVARLRERFGAEMPLRTIFQAPLLAELAARIDAGLAGLAASEAAGVPPVTAAPPIRPVPREGALPLSASQLRQWFLVQLDPRSADYNLPVAVRLAGELRPEVLAAALGEIVRRHEALRTTFEADGGRPFAVVSPHCGLPLPLADLAALPAPVRQAEIRRLAGGDRERPFDLTRGPLVRAILVRLAAAEHVLAATFHHIVFDGSSLGVFLRELAALYEAFAAGRPSPLPELPVQYVDYAAWQRDGMASPALAEQTAYWKQQLATASRVLELPTDRPRPAVQSHRGRLLRMSPPPSLAAGLKTLTSREGVTLFMAVLSGYATVLGRYTGQRDLNIGTFVANRRREALERLIGFFVNTLVLRADLTGDPTFRELLARTREMTLDAFERQELPFEQLLEELEIGRDLSRTPLFQVMFGVQNFAIPSLRIPGLVLDTIGLADHERTTTDLSFYMWEEAGSMTCWMEFSTDLFDAVTVERMFSHIGFLLAAAEADPGRRLSELPLIPESERRQILRDWSAGGAHRMPAAPVHERLREQARRTPEAPAVLAGGGVLTYGELARRAGRVARGLRRLGIGPETLVGLCIDRSPEMIVALYGILGAGAAYLPLDPALPADRLVLLTGDAGVPVVLTRRALAGALPQLPARLFRVDVDFDGESGDGLPTLQPLETLEESAAYVLYTSGSTGVPKGVVVEHRALASFVEAALERYEIGPGDRVLQFANLAFDTSAEEIYPCLSAGGVLVLRDDEMLASPSRFLAACAGAGITVLDLPTAWWHELSAWIERDPPAPAALSAALRLVILGGERAQPERVRGWLAATGAAPGSRPRLFNSYGPTEGTVVATACDLAEAAPAVPVGRPLRGVEVYVLDAGLEPVPAGVPGEIWLGGADLARGYLGHPDLTAERFVPSPFAVSFAAGARLYRTGDLGRWRPDGQLDFAGRADDQVKIRGFRIEPAEVAASLARHPAIQDAVVVAYEVRPGELELAAYAVPSRQPWPETGELRAFLKASLPAYMIPAGLTLLPALPRTPTGKVDRRSLPAPDRAARQDREHAAAPETPTEELLAGIWQQLLGVEGLGVYDNFFDLGGHSLLAPQVISRVEETFQIELPLRVLFEAPTVAQMANAVEQILVAQIEELSEEEVANLVGGES